MTPTRARTIQYLGILLSLGLIAVGYWYFSVRAGVKTNTGGSQSQGIGRLSSGLAGYWKLDDGSGTSATDASTNGNTGTLTNGPTWTTGQIVSAVDFDGTDDYITVADTDTLDFADTTNFTLSGWFNRDTFTTDDTILAKSNGQTAADTGYNVYIDDATDKVTFVANDGTDQYKLESTSTFTATGWHHFSIVWDESGAGQTKMYIDGANANATATGTFANVNSIANAVAFRIGAESDAGNPFDGKLDEVRVYGRNLSDDEVQRLYRLTTPTAVDTGLKGYWSFDGQEVIGTKAYDLSGAGNNGTLTSGPAATRGIVGQALSFDGADDHVDLPNSASLKSSDGTFSAWVKLTTDDDENLFAAAQGSNTNGFSIELGTNASGFCTNELIAIFNTDAQLDIECYQTANRSELFDGNWHHIVVTQDTTTKLYLDGVARPLTIASGTDRAIFTSYASIDTFRIGNNRQNSGNNNHLGGSIDEVRVYNRVLSAAEIKAQYDAASPDKTNSSSSQAQGMGRLDSGLRGYWKLDEGTGTTTADSSVNGITALTLTNGPTWTTGQVNGALDFDGTDDYATVANPAELNFVDGQDFSVSGWFNRDTFTTDDVIVAKRNSIGVGETGFIVYVATADNLVFRVSDGVNEFSMTSTTTITAAGWHHFTAVFDENSASFTTLYIDGKPDNPTQSGTITNVGNLTYTAAFRIGIGSAGADPFDGKIDEIRVYDRVLSADEVGQLYRLSTPTAVDTSLKGFWAFNGTGISGTTAFDRSGAGNTGTLTNGPVAKRGAIGQSLDFDGTNDYVNIGDVSSIEGGTRLTASAWVNADNVTGERHFFDKSNCSGVSGVFEFLVFNGLAKFIVHSATTTYGTLEIAPATIATGRWYQLTGTYDGSYVRLYINGVEVQAVKTAASSITLGSDTTPLQMGGDCNAHGGLYWDGRIDEARVYNRALSDSEIKSMYDTAAPDKVNTSVSTPQGTGRLDSDLVGYWKLDENTGTSAADSSTNGNTGTLTNGPTWTTGRIGSAVNFDGINDEITTTTSYVNPQDYTVSAWFNTTVASGTNIVGFAILQTGANATQSDRQLYIGTDGKIYHGWFSGVLNTVVTPGTYNDGAWHHAVGTHSSVGSGIGALYVDGALVGTGTGSAENTTGWWRIAQPENSGWNFGVDGYFNGKVDEVRVYNRALSADEVSQLYRLTAPTSVDTSLKGYWSFNGQDMNGTTAYDRSGARNSATLNNGVAVGRGKVGQAVTFDGVNDYIATDADFNQLNGATAMTASIWVKTTSMPSERHFFQKSGCQGLGNGGVFELGGGFNAAGKPEFTIYKAGGSPAFYQIGSSASITDGAWHMVTGTYDGANLRIYVDAVDTGSTPAAAITLPSITGTIEFGECVGVNFLAGSLDEARLYNRALSVAEIQALYNSGR